MSQLIVIDRTNDDPENPLEIQLPEGTQKLGFAGGVEWHRLPEGELMPGGTRAPTEEQLAAAMLELPAIRQLKANARRRIEAEVGDAHEILADQAKQIEALTALVSRMAADYLGGTAMDETTKTTYLQRVETIVGALDSGSLTLRGDMEGTDAMIMKVLGRSNRINEIIAQEYLPRRDGVLS